MFYDENYGICNSCSFRLSVVTRKVNGLGIDKSEQATSFDCFVFEFTGIIPVFSQRMLSSLTTLSGCSICCNSWLRFSSCFRKIWFLPLTPFDVAVLIVQSQLEKTSERSWCSSMSGFSNFSRNIWKWDEFWVRSGAFVFFQLGLSFAPKKFDLENFHFFLQFDWIF